MADKELFVADYSVDEVQVGVVVGFDQEDMKRRVSANLGVGVGQVKVTGEGNWSRCHNWAQDRKTLEEALEKKIN